ncbi:hypothetical protein FQA39_LY16919 [Lamprigera yunnana]|nr:hypothetical protein FQA39_LY16919 [Lamprigera yunnana]
MSDRMDSENVDDDDHLQSIASDRSAGIKRKRFDKNITDCKDCQQFCVELNYSNRSAIRESFKLAINPAKNYKGDLLKTVKSRVSTKTKAKIIKIDKVKNGAIHIKCDSVKDKEAITNTLNKENKDN